MRVGGVAYPFRRIGRRLVRINVSIQRTTHGPSPDLNENTFCPGIMLQQHNILRQNVLSLALLWQISEALGFCLEAPFRLNRSGEDGADRELERGAADVAFAVFD